MIRNCIQTIMALLFFLLPCTLPAQETTSPERARIPVRTLAVDSLAYQAGESLDFQMHYTWGMLNSNVGSARVVLDTARVEGLKCFHTTVSGKTTRLFDLFFKVRENFQSWFTCDGLRPVKFSRDSHEGPYSARNDYDYHWGTDSSYVAAEVYTSSHGTVKTVMPLDDCTFDLPSLFFFARNMDFSRVEPGKKHPMTFAVDDDVYDVYFIMYGPETIHVKGVGNVRTIRFGARLLAGEVFTGDQDMSVWITDDENRSPVYFEAPILEGTASGWLTGWSGLKHDFSSRVI